MTLRVVLAFVLARNCILNISTLAEQVIHFFRRWLDEAFIRGPRYIRQLAVLG